MREIPLTRGYFTLVDDTDYESVMSFGSWYVQLDRRAPGSTPYARSRKALMHSVITGWPYVDHVDGDGLNNQRSNLRQATHALNMANKHLYRNNKSGFKGVYVNRYKGRPWGARIRVDTRVRRLGNYDTPEEAARAYDQAALATWGEFARLNFSRIDA
jgi:hypothetical protein